MPFSTLKVIQDRTPTWIIDHSYTGHICRALNVGEKLPPWSGVHIANQWLASVMVTSSNGNIMRVSCPMCGESPVNSPHKGQWRRALMFFFYLRLNIRLSKISGTVIWDTIALIMASLFYVSINYTTHFVAFFAFLLTRWGSHFNSTFCHCGLRTSRQMFKIVMFFKTMD